MATRTTRTSRANTLQTAFGSSRTVPGEFVSLTERAAPSASSRWRAHPAASPLTPLPEDRISTSRIRILPEDEEEFWGNDRPGAPLPGSSGGGGGGDDNPDNPDDGSSTSSTPDSELLFRRRPREEEEEPNDVPLAFEPFNQLANAIRDMTRQALRRKSTSSETRTKVREPDTFDGSDPKKLRSFVVQCEINFHANEKAFRRDRSKITFAQSYLKGMALDYFEPDLLGAVTPGLRPLWMLDWQSFLYELQSNFGPHDPVAEAEAQLEQLRMKDTHRISKYIVEWNRLANQVREWGPGALRRSFYIGLPDRIKDEIARHGKPDNIHDLRALAQQIDQRYWERKEEISRAPKAPVSNSSNNHNSSKSSSSAPTTSSAPKDDKSKGTSTTSNSGSSGGGNKKGNSTLPKSDAIAAKLGKDGKHLPEERQRRMNLNLCLFCGESGHSAKDCPKSTSRASKARAATVTTEAPAKTSASSEAKN